MIRIRWASSTNVASVGSILPRALDVDLVGAVDHDLRHGVVAEERLERSVAEDVVGDVGDDLSALLTGQRRPVESELLHDRAHDALVQVLSRLGRKQLGAEAGDAGVVDAGLEIRVRVGLLRPAVAALADCERSRLGAVLVRSDDAERALDSIVEAHG